ncbi:hypothetical protein GCM10023178_12000 [Actinomadura luteofluorescens]
MIPPSIPGKNSGFPQADRAPPAPPRSVTAERHPGRPSNDATSLSRRPAAGVSCWDFGVPEVTGRGLLAAVGDDTPGGKNEVSNMTCADGADVTQEAREQVANESGEPYG